MTDKTIYHGTRCVKITDNNGSGLYLSRLYVNGDTATLTHAQHKTLKGAITWANKVLHYDKR